MSSPKYKKFKKNVLKRIREHSPNLRPKRPWAGDFTLHGYNYMGPGNPMDEFPPTNADDQLALEHDTSYTSSAHYTKWTPGDAKFVKSVKHPDAKRAFQAKRIFKNAGLISELAAGGNNESPTSNDP